MDKPKATPKDFFLWAGAMIALYWSIIAFVSLIFNYIAYALPDTALSYYSDPYQGGISYEMASLIILFPLFLVLFWLIHRDIRRDVTRRDIWVRRWALVLTLFLAGAAMVIDLILLLTSFLNGEVLSAHFLLEVAVVVLVAAVVFMHFIADLWGYWEQYPQRARRVGWAAGALILLTVIAGFFIVGTPWQAQQYRLDAQRVSDLQEIQSDIVTYWQSEQMLPTSLSDLNDSLSGFSAPVDPQTNQAYGYNVSSTNSFELCADFSASSQASGAEGLYAQSVPMVAGGSATQDNWQHAAGHVCFDRTIDPARYPSLKTAQ
jgi:Domain of unknown function (DUF5671)